MNHLTVLRNSPTIWLGGVTFRANRFEIYEQLLAKLDPTGRSAVQSLPEIFSEWELREKKRSDSLQYVYAYICRKTEKGASLAEALRPFVDNEEYLVLAGGEIRGDLRESIKKLLANAEARQQMSEAVLTALWVPASGFLAILVMSVVLGQFLWPDFVRAIPDRFWAEWTKPCLAVQIWLGQHWPVSLCSVVLVAFYYSTLSRWTGPSREWFDRWPPWSIHKGRLAANVLTAIAALVGSGLTVRESFVMVRDRSAPYLRWHMSRIIRRYDSPGVEGVGALRTGFFSQRMMDRVEDAAAGRSFDETLRDVGDRSLKLIVRTLRTQAVAASLVLVVVAGLLLTYISAVIAFGIQDATDAFTRSL